MRFFTCALLLVWVPLCASQPPHLCAVRNGVFWGQHAPLVSSPFVPQQGAQFGEYPLPSQVAAKFSALKCPFLAWVTPESTCVLGTKLSIPYQRPNWKTSYSKSNADKAALAAVLAAAHPPACPQVTLNPAPSTFTYTLGDKGCVKEVTGKISSQTLNSPDAFGGSSKMSTLASTYCNQVVNLGTSDLTSKMDKGCGKNYPGQNPDATKYKDDQWTVDNGHIVAQSLGGNNDDFINLFPQWAGSNRFNGRWKKWETALETAIRMPECTDDITITITFNECAQGFVPNGGSYAAEITCACWEAMASKKESSTLSGMVSFGDQKATITCGIPTAQPTDTFKIKTDWINHPILDDMKFGGAVFTDSGVSASVSIPQVEVIFRTCGGVSDLMCDDDPNYSVTVPSTSSIEEVLKEGKLLYQSPLYSVDGLDGPWLTDLTLTLEQVFPFQIKSVGDNTVKLYTTPVLEVDLGASHMCTDAEIGLAYARKAHLMTSAQRETAPTRKHGVTSVHVFDAGDQNVDTAATCLLHPIRTSISPLPSTSIRELVDSLSAQFRALNPNIPVKPNFYLTAFGEQLDPNLTWKDYAFNPQLNPNIRLINAAAVPSLTSKQRFVQESCRVTRSILQKLGCTGV